MGTDDGANASERGRRLKVSRLLDTYDLEGIGDELERLWTNETDDRMSLRQLATHFNQALLRSALQEANEQPIDGEVENLYRLLTADDVSAADRTRATRRLERMGIDVDRLLTDFVTYQAIRTYLTEVREAAYEDQPVTVPEAVEDVQRLRGRVSNVTEQRLASLRTAGQITLGDSNVIVGITVVCEECGEQFEADRLMERGGCGCAGSASR